MLIKGTLDKQNGEFIIYNPLAPTFDDCIGRLAVMFELYPTKNDQQLHDVRRVLELIGDIERLADRLPELPRNKGVEDNGN